MKKQYLIILIIALIALVGFLVTSPAGKQPGPTNTLPAQTAQPEGEVVAEIQMKEEGYEPSAITVQAGKAVRFINSSSGNRWPASNIHPTHELYPEFDPKRELKPGESWTFTFRKPGKWRMHDHLFAYMKGTITVE